MCYILFSGLASSSHLHQGWPPTYPTNQACPVGSLSILPRLHRQRYRDFVTLMGEARLWYETLRHIEIDWMVLQVL